MVRFKIAGLFLATALIIALPVISMAVDGTSGVDTGAAGEASDPGTAQGADTGGEGMEGTGQSATPAQYGGGSEGMTPEQMERGMRFHQMSGFGDMTGMMMRERMRFHGMTGMEGGGMTPGEMDMGTQGGQPDSPGGGD